MQWVVDDLDWNWGLNAVFVENDENKGTDQKIKVTHLQSTQLEFNDVDIEKSKSKFFSIFFKFNNDSKLSLVFRIHD